jgi:Spy/CpxP family protein refolding chaperone
MLLTAALVIGLALSGSAQVLGQTGYPEGGGMGMMGGGSMGPGMGPGMGGGPGGRDMSHEGPLISIILDQKQEIGLSLEQEKRLRDLRTEFSKESARRTADIRVAEIELEALLEQEKWDLSKIEPKVKQIATLQGDLRLARIKTLEAGRAVLTPQQLERLKQVGHRMRGLGGPGLMGPGGGMGPGGPMSPRGMPGPGGSPAPRQ